MTGVKKVPIAGAGRNERVGVSRIRQRASPFMLKPPDRVEDALLKNRVSICLSLFACLFAGCSSSPVTLTPQPSPNPGSTSPGTVTPVPTSPATSMAPTSTPSPVSTTATSTPTPLSTPSPTPTMTPPTQTPSPTPTSTSAITITFGPRFQTGSIAHLRYLGAAWSACRTAYRRVCRSECRRRFVRVRRFWRRTRCRPRSRSSRARDP